jgi:four helix bundle protein
MPDLKSRDLCERTFRFATEIVMFCVELARIPGARRQIAGQLLEAGTSVGANAEEAKAAYSRRDFASKNSIVLREAREALYWLRLIAAAKLSSDGALLSLIDEANQLVSIYTVTVRKSRMAPVTVVTLWGCLAVLAVLLSSSF